MQLAGGGPGADRGVRREGPALRAAVSTAQETLELADVPDPTPGEHGLVLKVDACGICGSDLHMAHSLRRSPGIVFGHEFAGTVVAKGAAVVDYSKGDRVVGFPLIGCRRCPACLAGETSKCPSAELVGAQRPGGYAEYVAVESAYLLPEALAPEQGALVEPLAVAHHALAKTERERGDPVLVLGAGPVGLAVALWAQHLGASEVVVSDPQAHRRELAARLGMTVVDPETADAAAAFADVTGSLPRAIVECIGRAGAIQHATEVAAADAHVTLVGACTTPDTFRPMIATSKELTMRFALYYRRSDFTASLAALEAGLDAAALVTGHVSLDDLPARFATLMGQNSDCKVMINP